VKRQSIAAGVDEVPESAHRRTVRRLTILGLAALWALVPITRTWQGRVEVHVALAWITAVVATGFVLAAAVIIKSIERGHDKTRKRIAAEIHGGNVIPIRRNAGDETMVLAQLVPVAVGRARPTYGTTITKPGRQLSYTAGDATIDAWIQEVKDEPTG
jgi:hypothetical protein